MPSWRPASTLPCATKKPTPMSLNSPLVNAGPAWQALHWPRPTKSLSPRSAEAG